MDREQFIAYVQTHYSDEDRCIMFIAGDLPDNEAEVLVRLGVSELVFYPEEVMEEESIDDYMTRMEMGNGWNLCGHALLHEILFHMDIEADEPFAFHLSFPNEGDGWIYLSAFAECLPGLFVGEDGLLEPGQDLLDRIKIRSMSLRADTHNLESFDCTLFDAVFDVEECEVLYHMLQTALPGLEIFSLWEVTGSFCYPDTQSGLCMLDIETLCQPLPEDFFVAACGGRMLAAQQYYIHICTHVLDESNLQNFFYRVHGRKYLSEIYLGFLFWLPQGYNQRNAYALEWNFVQECFGETWLYGKFCASDQLSWKTETDDAFLCYFLGIAQGRFFAKIRQDMEEDFFPGKFSPIEIKDGKFALFSHYVRLPDTRAYRFCIEAAYVELNYDRRREGPVAGLTQRYSGFLRKESLTAFSGVTLNPGLSYWAENEHAVEEQVRERFDINDSVFQNLKDFKIPGLSAQIDPQDGRFQIQTAPAAGESYLVRETELSEWDSGFGSLPVSGVNAGMKVEYFRGEGDLSTQEFRLELVLNTTALLSFSIGSLRISVDRIEGYLNYSPQNTGIGISGCLRFRLHSEFALYLSAVYEKEEGAEAVWNFEAGLYDGSISLDEIIEAVAGYRPAVNLEVKKLFLFYSTDGSYLFDCGIEAGFPIFGGTIIRVEGRISKDKTTGQDLPDIYLSGQIEIQYFVFDAKIYLLAQGARKYVFSVTLDELTVRADYETNESGGGRALSGETAGGVLTVTLENVTIGSMIKALMRVLRPNVNFKLPKPWDLLNRIGFPRLKILFHTDTKDISVTMPVDLDLLVLQVTEVGFTYVKREDMEKARFDVLIRYTSPFPIEIDGADRGNEADESNGTDSSNEADGPAEGDADTGNAGLLEWDAFEQSAPGILSGQEKKKFEILYFGLGRRIDLGLKETQDQPLFGLLDICREHVKEVQSVPTGLYDSSYGWFIGARFRVLEFLEAGLFFYDPLLYGIQAKVLNNDIVPLKGLDITIYYRKVTDDIGLFFADVCLPDCIRNMEFGALSVTLPRIQVWLYTNGNFKVNFGFPADGDFSESFALQYGLFYGRGGFYFGCLNGDTSSQVPATDKGYFDPVVELGIGITVGIGKRLNAGVLNLTASLELTAVFEGVFARYISWNGETKAVYYRCRGTAVIAGEIAGEVNFYVIKAGFRLYASAAVTAVLEAGRRTEVTVEASFAVSAYIKIWIIRISFCFAYTYRDTFVLGEESVMPWEPARRSVYALTECAYDWTPVQIYSSRKKITLWLFPDFTKEDRSVVWYGSGRGAVKNGTGKERAEEETGEKWKIVLVSSYNKEDFVSVLVLLCTWALGAQKRAVQEEISKEQVKELLERLTADCEAFDTKHLQELFSLNVVFDPDRAPFSASDERRAGIEAESGGEVEHVPMPLPPVLLLKWESLNPDGETYDRIEYDLSKKEDAGRLFTEYCLFIVKAGLQEGLSYMQEKGVEFLDTAAFTEAVRGRAGNLSGMTARALFAGNRKADLPVYEAAGQEFDGLAYAGRKKETIVHRLTVSEKEGTRMFTWQNGENLTMPITEEDLDYPQKALTVFFAEEPRLLPFGRKEHCPAPLYGGEKIYRDDKAVCSLWKAAEDISALNRLHIYRMRQNGFCQDARSAELAYEGAFLLSLEIHREREGDTVYDIVSAGLETREQIKELISDREYTGIDVTALLRRKIKRSSEEKPSGAWYIEQSCQKQITLIRRNLSDITTPWQLMMRRDGDEEALRAECVSIESMEDLNAALVLLDRMLETGGEGNYISLGQETLPSELFEDDGRTRIGILIRTAEHTGAPYLCLEAEAAGEDEIPVIDNEELDPKYIQTLDADEYGFSFVLKDMEETWGQLVYCVDGDESLPVSPQSAEGLAEAESFYIHLFRIRSGSEEKNPYDRVVPEYYDPCRPAEIQSAMLTLGFRDIAGNRTAAEDDFCLKEPFPILYHDRLYKVTELPFTRISYSFVHTQEGERKLHLQFLMQCMDVTAQADDADEGALRQIVRIYQQYSCRDVRFQVSLHLGEYAAPAISSDELKEGICSYLDRLRRHLEGNENPRPGDVSWQVSFDCPVPEQVDGILCLPLAAKIQIERDGRYVDKISAPPQAQTVCSCIPPQEDLATAAAAFEHSVENCKLAVKDGLYAIFLPEHTLQVSPPETNYFFYSMPPFCVRLMGRDGMVFSTVYSRITGKAEADKEAHEKKTGYYHIDLEVWMLRFLTFFEQLFTPDKLTLLLKEDVKDTLRQLLDLKRMFADKLAVRTENLFLDPSDQDDGKNSAREAFADFLRKDLAKGYQAAGCAVYPVRQKLGAGYALDGSLENAPGIQGTKFTDSGYAALVMAPENPENVETISLEKSVFSFTHLEDCDARQWYRFLLPFAQKERYIEVNLSHYGKEAVLLPVPLRRYPAVPVLSGQRAEIGSEDYRKPVWNYEVSLQCALSAQDRLYLHLSAGQEERYVRTEAYEDLFESLAQFIFNQEEYESLLFDMPRAEAPRTAVLEAFRQQAESICDCLERNGVNYGLRPYVILAPEYADGRLRRFRVEEMRLPEGISPPALILIDDHNESCKLSLDESGQYYTGVTEKTQIVPDRVFQMKLHFTGIDLRVCQHMEFRITLKRNASFDGIYRAEGLTVNPAFIYETPEMGFGEVIFPYLRYAQKISAGQWSLEGALSFLQEATAFCENLTTELFISLGQRVGSLDGAVLFRPLSRRTAHVMTRESAKEFLLHVQSVWEGRGLENKGQYLVKLSIRQYAIQQSSETESALLVEIPEVVFTV